MSETSIAKMLEFWKSQQQPDSEVGRLNPVQAILSLVQQIDKKSYHLTRLGVLNVSSTPFRGEQKKQIDYMVRWAHSVDTHRHDVVLFLEGEANPSDPLAQFKNRGEFPKEPAP